MKQSIVHLDDEFSIEMEPNNFMLRFNKPTGVTKNGKEVISNSVWYYPRLIQAIRKYLDMSVKPCQDVQEVYDKLLQVEANLKSKFS